MRRLLTFVAVVCLWASQAHAQPQPVQLSTTTCAPGAPVSGCTTTNVSAMGTAIVQISQTFVGTLAFEGSVEGNIFNSLGCTSTAAGSSAANSTTTTGSYSCPVAGFTQLRVRFTAYTSGAARVAIQPALGGGGSSTGGSVSGTVSQGTASATDQWLVNCATGCAAATADADDASIATGQTNSNANALNMVYDGSVWRRLTFGTAGTASAQVLTVQGIASMTPLLATLSGTNTVTTVSTVTNLSQLGGNAIAMGSGTRSAGTQRVSIATDDLVPVSSATLATAAKQPALGTAGTASADVLTVQGIASGTNLNVTCSNCSGSGVSVNEDVASANADPGTPAYAVRKATPVNTSGADGDYEPLQISAGRLWTSAVIDTALPAGTNAIGKLAANSGVDIGDVDVTSSALPTGASTSANQTTEITALQLIDNPVAVAGTATYTEATTSANIMGAVRRDADTTLVDTTNEVAPLQVNAGGQLKTAVIVSALPTGAATQATLATVSTDTDRVADAVEAANAQDVAHGTADSGTPVKIGCKASAATSNDTLVDDDDRTNCVSNLDGTLIVWPYAPAPDYLNPVPVAITDGSSTSVMAAAGSGIRNYITDVECANTSATGVTVNIRDGTAGAVMWTMACPPTVGGNNRTFAIPLRGSTNTAVAADPSASASTITISIKGFKSKL